MMMFAEKIKQLREERQIPQRVFAAALEIDTATYCKIEKRERRAKREQEEIIAKLLQTDTDELLSIWLADQIAVVIANENRLTIRALDIVKQSSL